MNNTEDDISLTRFDETIRQINEQTKRIKEIDAKIAEKKRLLRETNSINLADIGLLPVIW